MELKHSLYAGFEQALGEGKVDAFVHGFLDRRCPIVAERRLLLALIDDGSVRHALFWLSLRLPPFKSGLRVLDRLLQVALHLPQSFTRHHSFGINARHHQRQKMFALGLAL